MRFGNEDREVLRTLAEHYRTSRLDDPTDLVARCSPYIAPRRDNVREVSAQDAVKRQSLNLSISMVVSVTCESNEFDSGDLDLVCERTRDR